MNRNEINSPLLACAGCGLLLILLAFLFGGPLLRLSVVLIVLLTANGYWLGGAAVLAGFAGLLAATVGAVPVGRLFEGPTGALLGTAGLLNRFLSMALAAVFILLVVAVPLSYGMRRWIRGHERWRRLNRPIGAGLGFFEGGLTTLMVLWASMLIAPALTAESASSVPLASQMRALAHAAHDSAVGRAVERLNPLAEVQLLRVLRDVQEAAGDDEMRAALAKHPTIRGIRERQSIRTVIQRIEEHPGLASFEDGISDAEARRLLSSGQFLAILDESGVLRELSAIATEIEQALTEVREQLAGAEASTPTPMPMPVPAPRPAPAPTRALPS